MTSPLVATKLYVPRRREGLVERRRLLDRLRRGVQSRLILVSAPAGFGKTTLLAEWLAESGPDDRAVGWLSLDQTDNDALSFWSHLIAAVQRALPGTGDTALQVLHSGPRSDGAAITELVNDLGSVGRELCLVLDDYHVIDQPSVHAGMNFFVEHLPPNLHLVISTRADPDLPLARLRARGDLTEIRSSDLRFTGDEISTYLSGIGGMTLSEQEIAVLGERTEGWVAALQLAALSMEGRDDVAGFIAAFEGSDRYIVDYLVEEVLQRQSARVRDFLLRTCFLSRLSGPLCAAVTGEEGAGELLRALDRNNLFLVRLDDRREWYRYHHLFADVLLTHFADDLRELLPLLHQRASQWYAQNGDSAEAIRHALAGGDFEAAADLMEAAIPALQRSRGEAILRGWAHELPPDLVRTRPVLGIGLVGGLASYGEFDSITDRLRDIEAALAEIEKGSTDSRVVVVDAAQLPRIPGAVALYRAALAQVRGDLPALIDQATRVLELAPADDHLGRAAGSSMLGIAHWSRGDLEPARRAWMEGRNGLQRAGHAADMLGASLAISDISLAQGHLGEAVAACEQALRLAAAEPGPALRGTADMHAALSNLHRERNDFDAAHRHLLRSDELGERAGLPQHPYRWRVAAALLRLDEGDPEGAVQLLEEAERHYVSDFFPLVRPVAALRARARIRQGRLEDALRWQRDTGLGIHDELGYLREFEHLTLARLLLAQQALGQPPASTKDLLAFLGRLLAAAQAGGRDGSVIEISLLQALALRQLDSAGALVALERALVLAMPEGYVRVFVNEGQPMAALLKLASKRGIAPAYSRMLLASLGTVAPNPPPQAGLVEPLSERELDVLRLLRSDLSGPDIARELGVSENTMRTHTRNIYDKLGVNSRRTAVRRAEELRLLAR